MDLRERRVREPGAALVRAIRRGDVAALRIGRQEVRVAVAAGREHHGMRGVRGDRPRDQIARDDPDGAAVVDDEIEHLVPREHRDLAGTDLALQRRVDAEQELLAGLAAGVERPRDLRAAEAPVRQGPAVLAREWHAHRGALIDDIDGDLGEAVDVGLARAEVAALHGVVEQPVHRVAVVLVVLRGVDPALRGDRVRAARRVLEAEAGDVVAELGEGRGGGTAGQAGPDDDHLVLALVRGVDELHLEASVRPLLLDGAAGDPWVELQHQPTPFRRIRPTSTAVGGIM